MSDNTMAEALRLQRAAAVDGFDWQNSNELWDKLAEEIGELKAAETPEHREEELGDVLFMVVNLARHLGVDPNLGLSRTNRKFQTRYAHVLAHADQLSPIGHPQRIVQMETLWQEAKKLEKCLAKADSYS